MGKKELTYNVYLQRRDNLEARASRSFDDYEEALDYAKRLWGLRYSFGACACDVVLDEHTLYDAQAQFIVKAERCFTPARAAYTLPETPRNCAYCKNCVDDKTYCRVTGEPVNACNSPACPMWVVDTDVYLNPQDKLPSAICDELSTIDN